MRAVLLLAVSCVIAGASISMESAENAASDSMEMWRTSLSAGVAAVAVDLEQYPQNEHELPVDIEFDALLLNFGIKTGIIAEDHVAVLSLKRLLLKAIGEEHIFPKETWDKLRSFGVTKQVLLGRKATYLARGLSASRSTNAAPHEICATSNGGDFSVSTLQQENPMLPASEGPQIHDFLNFYEVARSSTGLSASWCEFFHLWSISNCHYRYPNKENYTTLCVMAYDGMLTGVGHMTDTVNKVNIGSLNHPVDEAEAESLLLMDDEQRRDWIKEHGFITEYNEYMVTLSNAKAHGHLGFLFSGVGGGADAVAQDVAKFSSLFRVCYCCLREAFETSATNEAAWAKATAICDLHCEDCIMAEKKHAADSSASKVCEAHASVHAGRHYGEVQCSRCAEVDAVCHNCMLISVCSDLCGSQDAYLKSCTWPVGTADGAHLVKSVVMGQINYYIRVEGWYVGTRLVIAAYHDADPRRRDLVREWASWAALEAKNKFCIAERVEVLSAALQRALLTDDERERGSRGEPVDFVVTVGPERWHFWSENQPSDYHKPAGVSFHEGSGTVIYVDNETGALRSLRLAHCKAYNDQICTKSAALFVGVALRDERAYITDERGQCIWTIDLSSILTMNRSRAAGGAEADSDEPGESRGGNLSSSAKFEKVLLSAAPDEDGVVVQALYGVAIDVGRGFGYVTDVASCCLLELAFSSSTSATVRVVSSFGRRKPRGVAVIGDGRVLVAVGSKLMCVDPQADEAPTTIFEAEGAELCGVCCNGSGDRVVVSSDGVEHSIWELRPVVGGKWTSRRVMGGQTTYIPGAALEGTASAVPLWRPTMVCFACEAVIFVHAGRGSIQMITNLHAHAEVLMPRLRKLAEAVQLGDDKESNATNLPTSIAKLSQAARLMEDVRRDNAALTGRPLGQGNDTNFSNSSRRAVKATIESFSDILLWCEKNEVPLRVTLAIQPKAFQSLCVETFFPFIRSVNNSGGGNPYALQCAQYRGSVINEEAKKHTSLETLGWSYHTSPDSKHYQDAASHLVAMVHKPHKPGRATRTQSESVKAERDSARTTLSTLFKAARLFRKARTLRVTDNGKQRQGTAPTQNRAGFVGAAGEEDGLLTSSKSSSRKGTLPTTSRVVYHALSIIVVKDLNKKSRIPFFLVQVLEHVIEALVSIKPKKRHGASSEKAASEKKFWKITNSKPRVRVFNSTADLTYATSNTPEIRLLAVESMYGTLPRYFNVRTDAPGDLAGFEISDDAYEESIELVSGGQAPEDIREHHDPAYDDDSDEFGNDDDEDNNDARCFKVRAGVHALRPVVGGYDYGRLLSKRPRSG
jgi:hypothetical protein